MGDLVDLKKDQMQVRKSRLKEILCINGKKIHFEQNVASPHLNIETLLDAFLLLFDECVRRTDLKGPHHVNHFQNKFSTIVSEVQELQVNIGDFTIGEKIHQGTYGNVFLAKEKSSGGVFALKVINKFQNNIEKYFQNIETELNLLSKSIGCQWISEFKYGFQDVKRVYFVTEYIPGGSLLSWIDHGTICEEEARFYLAELVLALHEVHSLGFVHRNLKPSTIFLDKIGHIKLADFDCACLINAEGKVVSPTFPIEYTSQQYASPEVLLARVHHDTNMNPVTYGVESDYWSLGVIAYEIMFGRSPFHDESSVLTYKKITSYKETLKIPMVNCVSSEMTDFIKGLLMDQNSRMGYSGCLSHSVFDNIIWDTIRTEIPPFIPVTLDEFQLAKVSFVDASGITPEPSESRVPLASFVGLTKTLHNGTTAGSNYHHLSRGFNNSSFLEASELSFGIDERISNLRSELNTKSEILCDRISDIEELEKKVSQGNEQLSGKDDEIGKMKGEVQRLMLDLSRLEQVLENEKQERQQVETASADMLSTIKVFQERKLEEIQDELQCQKTIVTQRDNHICDMEATIEILRKEVKEANEEKRKALSTNDEIKQRISRSYRGSISIMESRLTQNTTELENQIKDMNIKHEEELVALQNALKRHETELSQKLSAKEEEVDILKGRLEESRTARECTLEDMNNLSDKFDNMVKEFKQTNFELQKKNKELEDMKQEVVTSTAAQESEQIAVLNAEIEKLRLNLNQKQFEFEQQEREARIRQRILTSKNSKLLDSQKDLAKANEEIGLMQSDLMKFRELQTTWTDKELILKEKDKSIDCLERKVASLNANVDVLKQALNILEEQLKVFELAVTEKSNEVITFQQVIDSLGSATHTLKDELKKAKCDMNEAKSLKFFVEKKLKDAELLLEKVESSNESQVTHLQDQLAILVLKNQELKEELDDLNNRFRETESSNEHLNHLVQALRVECSGQRDDNARVIGQFVKIKNNNVHLRSEIDEAAKICEAYKKRIEVMNENLLMLECEKNESEIKLQTILQQQTKMIGYLQTQSEIPKTKKKKTFADRIFGRDKEKDHFTSLPKTSTSTLTYPTLQTPLTYPTLQTPTCVLKEQNAVLNLEVEVTKLRAQLKTLKKDNLIEQEEHPVKTEENLESSLATQSPVNNSSLGNISMDTYSEDLSGRERDLFFAERAKRARLMYKTETEGSDDD